MDARTLERADLVVVDSHETAAREAGDLIANDFALSRASDMTDVVLGRAQRNDPQDITFFASQGLAVQDLYVAERVLARMQGALEISEQVHDTTKGALT